MGGIRRFLVRAVACGWIVSVVSLTGVVCRADDTNDVREQLQLLQQQNLKLQEQLNNQQKLIDSLMHKVSEVDTASQARATALQTQLDTQSTPSTPASKFFSFGKIVLSGEGGLAFFDSGSEGQYPNAAFRVDEARIFLDAQVVDNVFFFAELDLTQRESQDEDISVGELYLDFENISRLWNQDNLLNLKVGRFNIPFGEEYLSRYAIDNPLITHSLSDIWGVDEGVEIYGSYGKFDYVLAVQNGGLPSLQDYNADKAVVGRVGVTPAKWLRLSASAMRTGNLSVPGDQMSALWFGNGFVRALGPTATKFDADVFEGDIALNFSRGYVKALGGYLYSNDNDPTQNDKRNVYYYSVEGVYNVTPKYYLATRFSQIYADDGYPIVGLGDFNDYYFAELTKQIWRLSLGGGYHWSPNLLLKVDYSFEQGVEPGGEVRDHEDQFAAEAAFQF